MGFVKKGAPSAKSLNDPVGTAQATQSGNPGVDMSNPEFCYSSGMAPINSAGQVTDKQGLVQDWPYQRFTTDNELNPRSNQGKPDQLSSTPQAFGDYTADGKIGLNPSRSTLG